MEQGTTGRLTERRDPRRKAGQQQSRNPKSSPFYRNLRKITIFYDMTKAERTIAALKADQSGELPPPPQWDTKQRLALALMQADRQISCLNCASRYYPCRIYKECKKDKAFTYFRPKKSLMTMQMNRVNHLIQVINEIT